MVEPRMTGAFVGRGIELEQLDSIWARGERLVTLLGPGGVGKTRLAMEAARRSDGAAVVCSLEGAEGSARFIDCVAAALGLAASGAWQQQLEAIGRVLAEASPILVLDQAEHVVDDVARAIRRWLVLAPELRCLVTSRRALGMSEEVRLDIGPLDERAGVRLFEAVAGRLRASAPATDDERVAIAMLVRRLDGFPLAIKLCAARAAVASPTELLARLAQQDGLLRAEIDDPVSRHRSLQAALDSSWLQLCDAEREALARCSVFRGSFTADAAAAAFDHPPCATLDLLDALRRHSLLRRVDADGCTRFALYQTIRTYAAQRLDEQGDRAAVLERAARHFLRAGRAFARAPRGELPAVRTRTRAERANLLWAIDALIEREADAARLLLELHADLVGYAPAVQHLELLASAAEMATRLRDTAMVSRAHLARADVARLCGRFDEAESSARGAEDAARESAAHGIVAEALRIRGEVARARGDSAAATMLLARSQEAAQAAGDRRLEGMALLALANLRFVERRFGEVARLGARAYEIWSQLDDPARQALALQARGMAALECDDVGPARELLEESLAAYGEAGHLQGQGRVQIALAELAWMCGDRESAGAMLRDAIELLRSQGAQPWIEMGLGVLALLEVDLGATDAALAHVRQAQALQRDSGYVRVAAFVETCLAVVQVSRGALAAAEASFSRAREIAAKLEPVIVQVVEVCEGLLDVAVARRAHAAGDARARRAALARASARLEALVRSGNRSRSHDLRVAERLVRAALRAFDVAPESGALDRHAVTTEDALVIGPGGEWLRLPGGARIELERQPWRRIALVLARRRLESPERGLTTDELFTRAWPGERVIEHAGRNRVWVALSQLRSRGFDTVLVRAHGRYALDPAVQVCFADPGDVHEKLPEPATEAG